jgi:hypothetical protein
MNENQNTVQVSVGDLKKIIDILNDLITVKTKYANVIGIITGNEGVIKHGFKSGEIVNNLRDDVWQRMSDLSFEQYVSSCDVIIYERQK